MDLIGREREILRILDRLTKTDFVLVGGYTVSSLTLHRFSMDCDLVVPAQFDMIKSILRKEGYAPHIKKDGFNATYGGRFENYIKRINNNSVAVDLLIKSLVSRNTNASWSFDYIKKHSVLSGIGNPSVECRVPERELLVAMKIHSGRGADIRDIIMLIKDCNLEKVLNHIRRGDIGLLEDKINRILETLNDEKLTDSLKGVFRLKRDVKNDIKKAREIINEIDKRL